MVYSQNMQNFSLYIHIPFCKQLCTYCDFNTYAGLETLIPAYVDALVKECESLRSSYGRPPMIHSIYFGGGTPTMLPIEEFKKLIAKIWRSFEHQPNIEVTCEMNPEKVNEVYLRGLSGLGVNRLSIGMQSADDSTLNLLGRKHSYQDVIRVMKSARQVGFKNINLDLIFGVPEQSLAVWRDSLEKALILRPEHLSLYSLTLEDAAPLSKSITDGSVSAIDSDLTAEMYELAADLLAAEGFRQYEISNWARESESGEFQVCRHNLQYWRNRPYLGIGAGAHGFASGFRIANTQCPQAYVQCLDDTSALKFPRTPASETMSQISPTTEMKETLLMGLRLTEEGVSTRDFYIRFKEKLEIVFAQELEDLLELRLLAYEQDRGDRIRLTRKGRFLSNQVFLRFV